MNRELIEKVITAIEAADPYFDMTDWFDTRLMGAARRIHSGHVPVERIAEYVASHPEAVESCGTPGCIIGEAILLAEPDDLGAALTQYANDGEVRREDMHRLGATLLDIEPEIAYRICGTAWWPTGLLDLMEDDLSEAQGAVMLLRSLLDGQDPWEDDRRTGNLYDARYRG